MSGQISLFLVYGSAAVLNLFFPIISDAFEYSKVIEYIYIFGFFKIFIDFGLSSYVFKIKNADRAVQIRASQLKLKWILLLIILVLTYILTNSFLIVSVAFFVLSSSFLDLLLYFSRLNGGEDKVLFRTILMFILFSTTIFWSKYFNLSFALVLTILGALRMLVSVNDLSFWKSTFEPLNFKYYANFIVLTLISYFVVNLDLVVIKFQASNELIPSAYFNQKLIFLSFVVIDQLNFNFFAKEQKIRYDTSLIYLALGFSIAISIYFVKRLLLPELYPDFICGKLQDIYQFLVIPFIFLASYISYHYMHMNNKIYMLVLIIFHLFVFILSISGLNFDGFVFILFYKILWVLLLIFLIKNQRLKDAKKTTVFK